MTASWSRCHDCQLVSTDDGSTVPEVSLNVKVTSPLAARAAELARDSGVERDRDGVGAVGLRVGCSLLAELLLDRLLGGRDHDPASSS
jgi:hypothetical protein